MAALTWKDEGGEGPTVVFYDETQLRKLRKYGGPLPDTVERLGWMTRREARRRANAMGARFATFKKYLEFIY